MTQPSSHGAGSSQLLPGEERRRSQRVVLRVAVTLQLTIAGKKIKLNATTVEVSDHGAMLLSSRTFASGTMFEMMHDHTGENQNCRVTRAPVENTQGYLIPVEFAAPAPGFWRISFPPSGWKPVED